MLIMVPFYAVIFAMSKLLDPVLLIVVSTLGATLGEFVGYAIGYGGRRFLEKRYKKYFKLCEKWFKENGFLTILVFAATPLPDDIVGLIAGSSKYSKRKFFISALIGKAILTSMIVLTGRYSFEIMLNYLGL